MKAATIFIILFILLGCENNLKPSFKEKILKDTLFLYYNNDTLKLKAPIKNGYKYGEVEGYYENGILYFQGDYVNDTLNGHYKEFYPSGLVKFYSYFHKGKQSGEYVEFYDKFHDSVAVNIDGKYWIMPRSTKVKSYKFHNLNGEVTYLREYNYLGEVTKKKGKLFLARFYPNIESMCNKKFEQAWVIPSPSNIEILNTKQFVTIENLSDNSIFIDTIQINASDSTITRWSSKLNKVGTYNYQAISYLIENNKTETDTSNFKVIIK